MPSSETTPTSTATRIPERHEIHETDRWDLTHLYPTDEAWETAFRALQEHYSEIGKFRGSMSGSAARVCEALEFEKSIDLPLARLSTYASLRVSENAADPAFLEREARLENLSSKIQEACSFIGPELQAIPDEVFTRLLASPELLPWRTVLENKRRFKPHTLDESGERLLAMSCQALEGHGETFSQLTNVDLKFGFVTGSDGQQSELTQGSFSSFLVKPDYELRKRAFHQFYAEFSDHKFSLASTLANSVRTDVFRARARHYPSALSHALFRNNIPQQVYTNLVSTVRNNLTPLYRYYELRRRALGLKEIHHYDTYVPIVSKITSHLTFEEATDRVIAAMTPLGTEYTHVLEEGLRGRWCDRYESKGKRSGAFSSGCYGSPPYILMNYKPDVFSDMFTLAHEAGHSMHTWYAQREQSFQDYHYPIFLAEVASTFNEELLTHYLLEQTNDPTLRAYLINRQLDDLRGTIYRQTMFAEFEKIIHERQEDGDALTLDIFTGIYRELLKTYFGPRFTLDTELELECLRIPHFYSAFYVYQYATGMSAAVALSRQVLKSGDAERYLGFLKSGGKCYPMDTLAAAGVDMTSPAPIENALELFARRVDELAMLLDIDPSDL